MLSTAIIIFREIFEIALLLSVIMAATHNIAARWKVVSFGIALGVFGALVVAYFAGEISSMANGLGQELFNALVVFAAAATISWTVLWMSQHSREFTRNIKKLGQDISSGEAGLYSMAVVVALAVLREGSEIVLFIYSLLASGQPAPDIITGSFFGIIGGSAAGLLLYFGLIKISPKHIFSLTTWLLIFLAGGMASIGANFLTAAGYFSGYTNILWDSSAYLAESGVLGKTLHVLIGYSEQPTLIQVMFYIFTVATIILFKILLKDQTPVKKLA